MKNWHKTLQKSFPKQPLNAPFYRVWKTSRWGLTGLSVDRPADRPTVIFQTVCAIGRPVGRPIQDTESKSLCPVDRSVGRGLSREQSSLDGRPGPFQRAELSGRSTGSVGRPSCQNWRARLCTSVDRVGRPAIARTEL